MALRIVPNKGARSSSQGGMHWRLQQRILLGAPGSAAAACTRGSHQPAPPVATDDFTQFVEPDEQTRFSVEQLRFLARKRRHAAGLGPALPQCATCAGEGIVACHACGGTGVNEQDIEAIMG
jgi:hypothetical protein